ncbi:MAG: hypothetical protein ABSH34_22280 [Verrucomicrobiota bacterium]|jgi:hypothetical protein
MSAGTKSGFELAKESRDTEITAGPLNRLVELIAIVAVILILLAIVIPVSASCASRPSKPRRAATPGWLRTPRAKLPGASENPAS